jgi:hypothetical protein
MEQGGHCHSLVFQANRQLFFLIQIHIFPTILFPANTSSTTGCTVVMAQRLTRSGASGDRRNPLGTPIPPPIISDLPSKFFLLPPKSLRIFSSLHLTPLLRRNLASRPPFLHFKPTSLEELLLPIPVWQKSLSCDWIPSSSHLQDPK